MVKRMLRKAVATTILAGVGLVGLALSADASTYIYASGAACRPEYFGPIGTIPGEVAVDTRGYKVIGQAVHYFYCDIRHPPSSMTLEEVGVYYYDANGNAAGFSDVFVRTNTGGTFWLGGPTSDDSGDQTKTASLTGTYSNVIAAGVLVHFGGQCHGCGSPSVQASGIWLRRQ